MGLRIDVVKQGHGSTNDGNTARRFFANANVTAEIAGVSEELIRRFAIILEAISSGYKNSRIYSNHATVFGLI